MMNEEEMRRRLAALSADVRLSVLSRLAWNLTVAARDTYEFQALGVHAPQRLRAINEIQHRVLAQMAEIIAGGEPWDLLPLLVEHGDQQLRDQCLWALAEALKRYDQ